MVFSGREIGIERHAPLQRLGPIAVETLEHVPKPLRPALEAVGA
jgi:hypothetical protein